MTRAFLLLAVVWNLLAGGLVRAADPAPTAPAAAPVNASGPIPDDPFCVGKARGEICRLKNGMGGVCAPTVCGVDRPCLRCAPMQTLESEESSLWIPMVSLGATVAIVGFFFWFRLKKKWD